MSKKKVQKRSADTSIYLPIDTIFSIFTYLPVKSLLRFKSVSKPLKAIISDNEFKKIHHDRSKLLGRKKLLIQRPTGHFDFRDLESPELFLMEKLLFPLKRLQCAEVSCSCDGLVLLKDQNEYVLWNPSTREYRILESCTYLNQLDGCPKACGICYDSILDDYKVILICDSFYVIYSLNKGCWTKKTSFPCPMRLIPNCWSRGITTEGCVFWSLNSTAINGRVDCTTSTIIYYDVKSDEVEKLPMPKFVRENCSFGLTTLKGRLSLYGGTYNTDRFYIWIMEQDGWNRLMNICNLSSICVKLVYDIKPLWCSENGEILFRGKWKHQLLIYYPKRKQFITVSPPDFSADCRSPEPSICLESLCFPGHSIKEEATHEENLSN
ncbi:F-box/kelch-repeat protein At3g23880-like [Lycium ferocissimum]|uniref:F-box/kelch-repeat protein At3g23880-like n=1 Tax=Lycium ferocissimum TaxID=112874 RepID=UPI002814C7A7|nr:F-box/kelch-repeat protein At3g23880-like [Lycium ferocissimum]